MEADFTQAVGRFLNLASCYHPGKRSHSWLDFVGDLVNPTNLARGVGWKVKATKIKENTTSNYRNEEILILNYSS